MVQKAGFRRIVQTIFKQQILNPFALLGTGDPLDMRQIRQSQLSERTNEFAVVLVEASDRMPSSVSQILSRKEALASSNSSWILLLPSSGSADCPCAAFALPTAM